MTGQNRGDRTWLVVCTATGLAVDTTLNKYSSVLPGWAVLVLWAIPALIFLFWFWRVEKTHSWVKTRFLNHPVSYVLMFLILVPFGFQATHTMYSKLLSKGPEPAIAQGVAKVPPVSQVEPRATQPLTRSAHPAQHASNRSHNAPQPIPGYTGAKADPAFPIESSESTPSEPSHEPDSPRAREAVATEINRLAGLISFQNPNASAQERVDFINQGLRQKGYPYQVSLVMNRKLSDPCAGGGTVIENATATAPPGFPAHTTGILIKGNHPCLTIKDPVAKGLNVGIEVDPSSTPEPKP